MTFHAAPCYQERMNIVHTSDWHLGHTLYGKKRDEEFRLFLDWLHELLRREKVELLLVSGDIFDSGAPGTQAQTLYYDFLQKISTDPACSVVMTAGNHDSPSFLDAPRQLLSHLRIHVAGRALTPEEEVLELPGKAGEPGVIICAVPFLRDRDLYRAAPGDGPEDRDRKLAEGLRGHYRRCAEAAERLRAGRDMPVIAMGHLFVQGGRVSEGTDVRVGSLARVETGVFPPAFDYAALGHLHIPQTAGETRLRYSGSPLPLDFSETENRKSVCLLRTHGRDVSVETVEVPRFRNLLSLNGDWPELERRLRELSGAAETIWAEVLYTGQDVLGDLREKVFEAAPPEVDVLRIRNLRELPVSMHTEEEGAPSLENLTEADVFARLLDEAQLCGEGTEERRKALTACYDEILREISGASREDD